jgi:hypothetical protein
VAHGASTGLQVCYAGLVLQPASPHISSVFNGPPVVCFANARSSPWKHASLAACLGQLSLSLFLWSTPHWGPWSTWQHRSSPLGKVDPRAMGHVAAPELTLSGRQGLELRDMWQHRSSHYQGGKVRSRGTRGSTGAHLNKEARSGAAGHVSAPKPTSAGRCGLKL